MRSGRAAVKGGKSARWSVFRNILTQQYIEHHIEHHIEYQMKKHIFESQIEQISLGRDQISLQTI